MIVDNKSPSSSSRVPVSERKLSVELPNQRQVYTAGAPVVGIVRLGKQDVNAKTVEVKVSVVCVVRSVYHKYYGGTTHDMRRETVKLVHSDQTLWTSSDAEPCPLTTDLPFSISIPETGYDKRAKDPVAALPPSFHPGRRRGMQNFGTHGTTIGSVKYYVKVVVVRKGAFTLNNIAIQPFIFLPSSPPPPLLPALPEITSDPTQLPSSLWTHVTTSAPLRHHIFHITGHAALHLYLPRVPLFPRRMRIPFVLCLVQTSEHGEIPPADLTKASLFLQQTIRTCARGGTETNVHTMNAKPTDNILHGLVPQENMQMTQSMSPEKRYIWHGIWTCMEAPSFVNRQISCHYTLVAEVPIKGVGNGVKLVTEPIEICSGVTLGTNVTPQSVEDTLDLPPDYFELDGTMNDEESEEDEKS